MILCVKKIREDACEQKEGFVVNSYCSVSEVVI